MDSTDILIIGGGIIGLSLARELHRRGAGQIIVAEKGRCGEESSWAAAGMLGPQAESDSRDVMMEFCLESRASYPRFIGELESETGIDVCLDRAGTFYVAFDEAEMSRLTVRAAWQRASGLNAEVLARRETQRAEPFISPDVVGSVLFPDDWQVDNRKLLNALRRYADSNGIEIREGAKAAELINARGRVGGARFADGDIAAGMTVIAAGAWTSLIRLGAFGLPAKVKPIRGQMIAYRTAKRLFEHVIYSHDGYLVPRADGRILAGSTSEDVGFEKANTDIAISELRDMAERVAPGLSGVGILDKWCGLRPFAADGLPLIGTFAGLDKVMIATAHYRNGILLAPRTAEIVADSILDGAESPYFEAFGPDRSQMAEAKGQ